jgi:parvulin-like peptidyl-prolyl isomerase
MKKVTVLVCGFLIGQMTAMPSNAASIYAPVYRVNNSVITKYELQQRIKMLESFGTKGNLKKLATDQLINDRLRLQAAKEAGISTSQDEVTAGMEEFATRGGFTTEQLLSYFDQYGVSRESFVAFVRAGLLWRNVVRARFATKVNVTDNEVDATLNVNAISFPKMMNLAEIVLPVALRGPVRTRALAKRLSQTIKSEIQFSIAAKKFSKSDSAIRGGALGWVRVDSLPAGVSALLSKMEQGQISAPISQNIAIQNTVIQDTSSKNTTLPNTTNQYPTSQETTSQDTANQDTASQNTTTEYATSQDTASQDTTGQDTASQYPTSQDTTEPDTATEYATSQDTPPPNKATPNKALVIYQLRGIRKAKPAGKQVVSVSYVQVAMPTNKSGQAGQVTAAVKLINASDTCLDLQANTTKFGDNAVSSQSLPTTKVPARIGAELAKLDPNEASYFVADNGAINVVMLCNRAKDLPAGARDQIRNALLGRRIDSFGAGYLQELRGDAIIIKK